MASINKYKIVTYTTQQMYDLVNDVKSYPEFVPFCVSSEIQNATDDEVHATLTFSRGGLHKSFSTLNRLQPNRMVEIRLVNGPFRHLEGFWCFEAVGEGEADCRISFDLEFEFSSRLVELMFGPLFHQMATLLVDAFSERAAVIYGAK